MTLKAYQTEIMPNTLYAVAALTTGAEQLAPSIEVIGGDGVDIYGSNLLPAAAPAAMYKAQDAFLGIDAFGVVPNYLYIDGWALHIILSGVKAVEVV